MVFPFGETVTLTIGSHFFSDKTFEVMGGYDTGGAFLGLESQFLPNNNKWTWTLDGVVQEEESDLFKYEPSCEDVNDFGDGSTITPHVLTVSNRDFSYSWNIIVK